MWKRWPPYILYYSFLIKYGFYGDFLATIVIYIGFLYICFSFSFCFWTDNGYNMVFFCFTSSFSFVLIIFLFCIFFLFLKIKWRVSYKWWVWNWIGSGVELIYSWLYGYVWVPERFGFGVDIRQDMVRFGDMNNFPEKEVCRLWVLFCMSEG